MPKAAKGLKNQVKIQSSSWKKTKPCNNTTHKTVAVFIPALMPPQLGGSALCKSTAMAGMQQVVNAGWVLGGLLTNSGLPWDLAMFRELKHRAGSIQKGLLQVECALNPAGLPSISWWKPRTEEQTFWRSLILQSCRLNYILHLPNGEERACHCLHQSNSIPQPLISLIFHSLPWALAGSTMIKWCFHVWCRHSKGRQLGIWVLLMWTHKPFRQLQKETEG